MQARRDVTRLLELVGGGDEEARDRLVDEVYSDLRRLAGGLLRKERPGHTLQATALVNEAWLRLADDLPGIQNRAHFFGAAAQAMRRILVEHARARLAQKRGGGAARITFEELGVPATDPGIDVLALNQAMDALAKVDLRLTRVMELRYFTGCSLEEIAAINGTSLATVKRDWTYARAWLHDYMTR